MTPRRAASSSSSSTGTARWRTRPRSSPKRCSRRAATSACRCRTTLAARYVIGLGLADAMKTVAPELPAASLSASWARAIASTTSRAKPRFPLFDGARELLAELDAAGYLLAVATGKTRAGLARALASNGLGRRLPRDALRRRRLPEAAPGHAAAPDGPARTPRRGNADDRRHDARSGARAERRRRGTRGHLRRAPARGSGAARPLATVHSVVELREWLARNA